MVNKVGSPAWSFKGWDIWSFVKGRKKSVVALVTTGIGFLILDSASSAVIAGGLVEALWGTLEYYSKAR